MLGGVIRAAMRAAPLLRPLMAARARWRFRRWTLTLDIRLRRRGGRLVVDAPHGATLAALPILRVDAQGDGDGTLTLRLGENVSFGRGVTLEVWARGTNVLELGDHTFVDDGARVKLHSGAVRARDHVQFREGSFVKSSGELTVGSRAVVSHAVIVHCAESVTIGDRVILADRATVVDSDHLADGSDEGILDRIKVAPVSIGSNTFVGANSVVTRGARLGRNAAVGAGAVVRAGTYPDAWLLAGAPAQPLRPLRGASDAVGAQEPAPDSSAP